MPSPYPITVGTLFPVTIDLRNFDVDPDGNNDSTSGIQAAVDEADRTGQSCDILITPGTYLIGGPIRTTNAANGQILWPSWGGPGTHAPVIRMRGTVIPQYPWVHYGSGIGLAADAQCTFACGLSSGDGAMFGVGGPVNSSAGQPPQGNWFSNSAMVFEDLQFVTGTALGAINAALAWALQVNRCIVTPVATGGYTWPITGTTTQVGITTPYQWNNNNQFGRIDSTVVEGVYTGIAVSEHTHVGHVMCAQCHDGLLLLRSQHPIKIENYESQHNVNGISFGPHDTTAPGNLTRLFCVMGFEKDATGPFSGGYVVNDPNDDGSGQVWHAANNASPLVGFSMNGGSHITATSLG